MTFTMTFTDWIASTGLTTVFVAILGFLAKNWIVERLKNSIKYEYDRDLATHKANLKHAYELQIETLKAEFAKNHVRFSHVFTEMAETIIKTYQMLVELKETVNMTLGVAGKWDDEAIKKKSELFNRQKEFYMHMVKHKIYFSKTTAKKITDLTAKLNLIIITFDTYLRERSQESHKKISEAMDSLFNEVPKLLEDLEGDFQDVLGFEVNKKDKQ